MHILNVNASSYDKIRKFQNLLNDKGITVIAKANPNLILEVEDINLEEVLVLAQKNKVYFD